MKCYESLKRLGPVEWSKVSNPNFPFTDFAYLNGLEDSQCVSAESGWVPQHLALWEGEQLAAASLLYLKNHSYGEYIFDWAWAQAYQQHGVAYFPKLVSMVPLTPATGPKLLFAPGMDREFAATQLIAAAKRAMEASHASSLHYLFLAPEELGYFEREGFLIRHSFQYHWKNQRYRDFTDFLSTLKSRKRKQILRERLEVEKQGLQILTLTGSELTAQHATLFYGFYRNTIEKMGAIPYLNETFFQQVFQSMKDEIVFLLALEGATPIAGALYFQKGENLYGRYWGATKEVRNLHFELCYYRPVEYAIAKGIKLFEAGAQGEHKIARGFLPVLTYSSHWIPHSAFRSAIAGFIEEEKKGIEIYFRDCKTHSPFHEIK